MHRRCSTCGHPRLAEINERLRGDGPKYSVIAREFGLTRQSLQRHAAAHPLDQTEPSPPVRNRNIFDEAKAQGVFLGAFRTSGDLKAATETAGVNKNTLNKWLEHDEQFMLQFNQAKADLVTVLEATAMERATTGGQLIRRIYRAGILYEEIHEWRPSDAALIKLLSSLKPEVYGEKIAITQTSIVKAVDMQAWEEV